VKASIILWGGGTVCFCVSGVNCREKKKEKREKRGGCPEGRRTRSKKKKKNNTGVEVVVPTPLREKEYRLSGRKGQRSMVKREESFSSSMLGEKRGGGYRQRRITSSLQVWVVLSHGAVRRGRGGRKERGTTPCSAGEKRGIPVITEESRSNYLFFRGGNPPC